MYLWMGEKTINKKVWAAKNDGAQNDIRMSRQIAESMRREYHRFIPSKCSQALE